MGRKTGHIELDRTVESIIVGNRHRTDLGDLTALCESIEREGLLQPLTVTIDGVLVCGARRLAAIKLLGWRTVNVWVRSGISGRLGHLLAEHDHHEGSRKQLGTALSLLVNCAKLYARTGEQGKRLANQTLTNGIDISEDERATIRLAEPFAALLPEPTSLDVSGSSTSDWVELRGIEPLTFSLRTKRSTN